MKLALITDAWHPQINGVVTTLQELVQELGSMGVAVTVIHPGMFKRRSCPGYPGIDLAVKTGKALAAMLDAWQPDALHLATEGPLGWAARQHALKRRWSYTTAFHTKFPEILKSALRVPLCWSYGFLRHFHRPSSGVMVPTEGVLNMLKMRGFQSLKPWTHGVDLQLFQYHEVPLDILELQGMPRPYTLFVGRVSYEKCIDEFLDLQIPGTRVVCGVGPLEAKLKMRYPSVVWMGVLTRPHLARVYAAADVFVFPSRHETFGLVMLEAMACGTPVAAFPVDGPLQVLGAEGDHTQGGVLAEDLHAAVLQCLAMPRIQARQRAQAFGWSKPAQMFLSHLVAVHGGQPLVVDSLNCPALGARHL